MTIKDFFSFRENKYFWVNIIVMVVVAGVLVFGALTGVDFYTRHGESVAVPDVRNMTVQQAAKIFADRGLLCMVTDSSYDKHKAAGCILDYTPAAGQKVKEGRTIYLTINTLNVPLKPVPDVADNSSVRQAEARLSAVGFKLTENEYVSGEKDWVYGVKYRGRRLMADEKVPAGSTLTLMVGDGTEESLDMGTDSIGAGDSGDDTGAEQAPSKSEDSWF